MDQTFNRGIAHLMLIVKENYDRTRHFLLNRISAILSILFSFYSLFLFHSVCQAGQWQCSEERCAAQCSIIGAMQITTFDKKRYNLQAGDCQLTAIEVRCIIQCLYNHFYHIFMASSLLFMECILHIYQVRCNIRVWVNIKKDQRFKLLKSVNMLFA